MLEKTILFKGLKNTNTSSVWVLAATIYLTGFILTGMADFLQPGFLQNALVLLGQLSTALAGVIVIAEIALIVMDTLSNHSPGKDSSE